MRSIRNVVALALAIVMAFSLAGCGDKNVAAKVNGESIKTDIIEEQMKAIKEQYPQMFQGPDADVRIADFRRRLLDTLISQELVRQAAKDSGIEISDAVVDKQIAELKKGFADEKAFEAALAKSGITVERLREQVRDQLVQQELLKKLTKSTPVTDAEIKAYYEKNKTQFTEKAAVHAAHILFDERDKANAERVLEDVQDGGDFAELAKKYSKDKASAAKGGDLGWPQTPYVTEFQAAADKLRAGQISDLVHTPFGWHIIKVVEKRGERRKSLSEVKDQIKQVLIQQRQAEAYQKYLADLRKKAKIEIVDAQLKNAVAAQETTAGK